MLERHQTSIATNRGRYPRLITDVVAALAGIDTPRILSFGCSTGDECLDLAEAMPHADIVGCDIDPRALAIAREKCRGYSTIVESDALTLEREGPFDAVLALNVFCRYPQSAALLDISGVYPFRLFEEGLGCLAAILREGGLLALYNGQYFLEDADPSGTFSAAASPSLRNGWIEKADSSGLRVTDVTFRFAGETFDRLGWTTWLRQPGNRDRIGPDWADVTYAHSWRREPRFDRSLTTWLWRKSTK